MSSPEAAEKSLVIPEATLRALAAQYGTPLWAYDAATIRARIAELRAFDTIRYAQKASSNVHLLRLMRAEGVVADAVSLGEIERALLAGYSSREGRSEIVFTADVLDRATLDKVVAEHCIKSAANAALMDRLAVRRLRSFGRHKRGSERATN